MDKEKRQKYFVSRQDSVTVRCIACGQINAMSVAALRGRKHSLKVNCPCGEVFSVDLEFRQDYRQATNIAATFRALSTPLARARQCVVADQSNGGLLLLIDEGVPIRQDDRIIVRYRPVADSDHEVERIIRVRHYDWGSRIGGAFVDGSPATVLH
ncbi:hypothetical protein Despr_3198 [Desulfobulbus propionicus DSM 2032]|uniref:PilZ domain-containing protein n=1 Tax=Desulfobulbus propionicus (strain ATCC 33891 / DSM 2032 / VKM B-1956 / 1pr3) TaxID=577650 RepID=A0A7U3YQ48_DESPD|nr:hypothetical protein [Desulfobulbus propionicus]ADW19326.1 hypothetical protein Despr_3198 [Desulfobulbus propionicus DSM 2032]